MAATGSGPDRSTSSRALEPTEYPYNIMTPTPARRDREATPRVSDAEATRRRRKSDARQIADGAAVGAAAWFLFVRSIDGGGVNGNIRSILLALILPTFVSCLGILRNRPRGVGAVIQVGTAGSWLALLMIAGLLARTDGVGFFLPTVILLAIPAALVSIVVVIVVAVLKLRWMQRAS